MAQRQVPAGAPAEGNPAERLPLKRDVDRRLDFSEETTDRQSKGRGLAGEEPGTVPRHPREPLLGRCPWSPPSP